MYIYTGGSLSDCAPAPPPPAPRYPAIHAEGVQVLRRDRQTRGLRVRLCSVPGLLPPSGAGAESPLGGAGDPLMPVVDPSSERAPAVMARDVMFGDSAQDVVSAIGAPARIFFKSEDKMKIHSPSARRKTTAQKSDYFYNYFTLGFVWARKKIRG